MPEEALLDTVEAPVEETATDSADLSADSSTSDDSSSQPTETPELKGSSLWRDLKGPLYSGKSLTKDQIKAVRQAIQESSSISSRYPQGLGEVETVLDAVKGLVDDESVPLPQAIQETLSERQYFRELDSLYTAGDPQFPKRLREASPEAFENIAPAFIREYAELNPESYSAQMAQSVVQHMSSAEVPLQFKILSTFLPQLADGPAKDRVIEAAEAIYGWSEGMKQLSLKKIEPKAIPQAQNQPQNGQDPQFQAMDVTRREWNLETRDEGLNLVYQAAQREVAALKKSGLSEPEKKKVLGKVSEELDARLLMDKNYGTSMQGYLKAGNKSAYIQLMNSKRKSIVPAAVRRAVQDVIAERPAKAAPTAGQPTNKTSPTMKPAQGAMQFRKIAGPPKTLKMVVDLNRTTNSMLTKRQAYIKGEDRPVSWA